MAETIQSKYSDKHLIDLLLELANKIKTDTKVATLGKVKTITRSYANGYGIATVTPFPLLKNDSAHDISSYFFYSSLSTGDLVLVIFTDGDFRDAIQSGDYSQKTTTNSNIHNESFGVILSLGSESNNTTN